MCQSGLQAKIQQKSEEFANELKLEKEKMAKLEAESNERELSLESRASGLARLESELESKQMKFEATQEIERKRILEEKRKIQVRMTSSLHLQQARKSCTGNLSCSRIKGN